MKDVDFQIIYIDDTRFKMSDCLLTAICLNLLQQEGALQSRFILFCPEPIIPFIKHYVECLRIKCDLRILEKNLEQDLQYALRIVLCDDIPSCRESNTFYVVRPEFDILRKLVEDILKKVEVEPSNEMVVDNVIYYWLKNEKEDLACEKEDLACEKEENDIMQYLHSRIRPYSNVADIIEILQNLTGTDLIKLTLEALKCMYEETKFKDYFTLWVHTTFYSLLFHNWNEDKKSACWGMTVFMCNYMNKDSRLSNMLPRLKMYTVKRGRPCNSSMNLQQVINDDEMYRNLLDYVNENLNRLSVYDISIAVMAYSYVHKIQGTVRKMKQGLYSIQKNTVVNAIIEGINWTEKPSLSTINKYCVHIESELDQLNLEKSSDFKLDSIVFNSKGPMKNKVYKDHVINNSDFLKALYQILFPEKKCYLCEKEE